MAADDQLDARAAALVRQAMERFPPSVQLLLLLCCFDGLTAREAAELTGWDADAVRALREQALARLAELLAAAEVVLGSGGAEEYIRRAYQEMIEEQEPDPASVERIRSYLTHYVL